MVGADVARWLQHNPEWLAHNDNKIVGGKIEPMHGGVGGERHMGFRITGILDRTGTPVDRATFVNIEGFFLIPDHAKDAPKEEGAAPDPKKVSYVPLAKTEEERLKDPLPDEKREATAVLVRSKSVAGDPPELTAPYIVRPVNRDTVAQAIEPAREISVLTDTFVRPAQWILLALTVLIVIISAVSIMVSIYNSMSERRHEIAIMRALGARRSTVMSVVLLESILLALGGGVIGWALGHALVGLAGPVIADYTGVSSGMLEFAPMEVILIPALIVLATIVGYLPAVAAYRTDVGKSLTATP